MWRLRARVAGRVAASASGCWDSTTVPVLTRYPKPRMNLASSDIRSGVHGGSNVSSASTSVTPGTLRAASTIPSAIIAPGGAPHRGQAVEDLHLRVVDLDVVHEPELDDVHPELGILDSVQRLDDVFARDHAASVETRLADRDELIGAAEDEVEHVSDRAVERVVVDHRDVVASRPLDQVVLDLADLRKRVEVLLERAQALGRLVAHPEVAAVQVLVLDRDDALERRRRPDSRLPTMPGTRCTPSSTVDHRSVAARSSAASTPTRTFRVWSRKPRIAASPDSSSSARVSASRASKLE